MKKIPTLFTRVFEDHKIVEIKDEITPGCEDAFLNGTATVKMDGACCAMIDGVFYKRYDAKDGKTPPVGAIPCDGPDPVTGHWPHWVKVDPNDPSDKWFMSALVNTPPRKWHPNRTYEAVGPHFNRNPYKLPYDILEPHGFDHVEVERTFEGVKEWLRLYNEEGLVFWLNGEPVCKIKRKDFGFPWRGKK